MRYREATRKLARLGCYEDTKWRRGSHRKWINPHTGRSARLPDWGSDDLRIGTLRSVIRQLGLDWREFNEA
ncbi:MAG: type II toxin-antitoxin system HicA family toxin [Dehalococcoidia bacterium]|nr:type II toxin-antitoxin system HicA family toxin [Dehalococcoidia bacterium]